MQPTARAFVALGANIDEPAQRVRACMQALDDASFGPCVARSSLYLSAPVGIEEQPDFVNAVVELRVALAPQRLIEALLALELQFGRVRTQRNGPRRIDLDLLAFDARRIDTPELVVPHPRIAERAFVLLPWQEIAPDFIVAGLGRVSELARRLPPSIIRRIEA